MKEKGFAIVFFAVILVSGILIFSPNFAFAETIEVERGVEFSVSAGIYCIDGCPLQVTGTFSGSASAWTSSKSVNFGTVGKLAVDKTISIKVPNDARIDGSYYLTLTYQCGKDCNPPPNVNWTFLVTSELYDYYDGAGVMVNGKEIFFFINNDRSIELTEGDILLSGTRLVNIGGESNMIEVAPHSKIDKIKGAVNLLWGAIKVHTEIITKCIPANTEFGWKNNRLSCTVYKIPFARVAVTGSEFILLADPEISLSGIFLNEGSVDIFNEITREHTILDAGNVVFIDDSGEMLKETLFPEIWSTVNEEAGFDSTPLKMPVKSTDEDSITIQKEFKSSGSNPIRDRDEFIAISIVLGLPIIIVIIVWRIRKRRRNRTVSSEVQKQVLHQRKVGKDSSLDILEKRYAKGEITKEEFDNIKKDVI